MTCDDQDRLRRHALAARLPGPLSESDIGQFVDAGFVVLREAFSHRVAEQVRQALGRRLGVDLDNCSASVEKRLWLRENLRDAPFVDALTDRFRQAVDQLVGRDRWSLRREIGWWPVTLPGYGGECDDWHVEGSFMHRPEGAEQAVLPLFCFSKVDADGGGTRLATGSHHVVAWELWHSPLGLTGSELIAAVRPHLDESGWQVQEVVADAGDVVLAHPLLIHSGAPNRGARARVMAQPRYDLRAPKDLGGALLSAVELPIARQRN